MSKQQLIEAIREHNRSATNDFLICFNESALTNYLNHLRYKVEPRTGEACWVRPAETPAVVTRHH